MAELITELFNKGVYNLVNSENIPQEAASDELGWISTDDNIELSRGRTLQGDEKNYKVNQGQVRIDTSEAFAGTDAVGKQVKIAQQFKTLENPTTANNKQKAIIETLLAKPSIISRILIALVIPTTQNNVKT